MGKQGVLNYFQALSPDNLQLLESGIQTVTFADPTAIIHKGQAVSGAYLVTQGQLRVYTFSPQGSEATLYFINPGETCILALNCLFNDLRYPAWVDAAECTEVAVIPGPLYRQLFASEAPIQDMTVKSLSGLVFRLMDELEQIHSCTLDQRLANFMLSHCADDGTLYMTQQTIAGHLGTTREVVARLLQGFSAQALVATMRGKVKVMDYKRLSEIARSDTPCRA